MQSLLFHFRCALEIGTPCTPAVLINQEWPKFSSPKFALADQSFLFHLFHHQKGQKVKGHQGQVMCFQGKDPPTLISQDLCLSLSIYVGCQERGVHGAQQELPVTPLSRTPQMGDIKLTFPTSAGSGSHLMAQRAFTQEMEKVNQKCIPRLDFSCSLQKNNQKKKSV